MLYEIAITPDVFDSHVVGVEKVGLILSLMLQLGENGVIANLHTGRWIGQVYHRVQTLPQYLKSDIIDCLETLDGRHRLIRHQKRKDGDPKNDQEWLDLALDSHRKASFHKIILTEYLAQILKEKDSVLLESTRVSDVVRELLEFRSVSITKSEKDYREKLTPVLRYAKKLYLVDPYLSCIERYFEIIKLCLKLMSLKGDPNVMKTIEIHAGDPTKPRYGKESVADRLDRWKQKIVSIPCIARFSFKVCLWKDDPEGDLFHDRGIFTDQCGIEVPSGLDIETHLKPSETRWTILSQKVYNRQLEKLNPNISPHKCLGECVVVLEPTL